ncbi:ABC transporter permease [Desulfobacter hydrogenophilus]|uniref:ABC transporter permease n=1 Tax=Desulfobacter hydrogenophilus TaxID=2291 RepID=A0A328F6S6_9BACT|nr:ABC transporter permease [Desulfobacter hydrogenophilus]NDY74129.1 FtsX-like permease family protein [Desulfobacter hydrogenophilus]QBH15201.1 FtsX-like permease family protein [Desulfobacter hydrogenophilus]RAM00251.1 ABC transporter permease [Desulfobacter hydrogenophilus]
MIWNTFILALRGIRRNVMRSVLTILGIIIGVAAVITLVTIGNGTTAQVTQQIAAMGTNVLLINPGQRRGPGGAAKAPSFSIKDVQAIERQIHNLSGVAPAVSASAVAVVGNQNWSTSITGTTNDFFTVRNWTIKAGRTFSDNEISAGRTVCVVGDTIRENLFGDVDPLGQKLRLGKVSCQIVGLLEAKGNSSMGGDQDDCVIMPMKAVQRRFSGNKDIPFIQVAVKSDASTTKASATIQALLRKRRHLSDNEEDNFRIMDTKELATMLTSTTKTMTALLGAVAAVSLLVGGIGIMNIMLVSVTERTREIGIRLAIGAYEHEVLLQFLVESVVLSSFGGIFGIILALAASFGATKMLAIPFAPDISIIIIAFFFSAAVGVVFGYFPALKAARMDPIDALRHE